MRRWDLCMARNFFKNPYYIVAPRYTRTSAGVRVLYRLADSINKLGGTAFIFLRPSFNFDLAASPMDIAPFLSKKVVDYHFENGITPIVIYPETFNISKFNPPVRVRYLLNFNEFLFHNDSIEMDDYLLFYSRAISDLTQIAGKLHKTLNIPVSDASFFCPPTDSVIRSGGVFYAGKFKYHFGGKTLPITDGMIEITRDQPNSQTSEQIRDLFQKSEFFYSYEDTALMLEAILCGCPTILIPNEYYQRSLGIGELKGLGVAWGYTPEHLRHAQNTVLAAREQHLCRLDEFRTQIQEFLEDTQAIALRKRYEVPFAHGVLKSPGVIRRVIDMAAFLRDVIADRGLKGTIKIAAKRVLARRFNI
jgi:hypothetical protein